MLFQLASFCKDSFFLFGRNSERGKGRRECGDRAERENFCLLVHFRVSTKAWAGAGWSKVVQDSTWVSHPWAGCPGNWTIFYFLSCIDRELKVSSWDLNWLSNIGWSVRYGSLPHCTVTLASQSSFNSTFKLKLVFILYLILILFTSYLPFSLSVR